MEELNNLPAMKAAKKKAAKKSGSKGKAPKGEFPSRFGIVFHIHSCSLILFLILISTNPVLMTVLNANVTSRFGHRWSQGR